MIRRVDREPESPGMALRAMRKMNHKTLGDLARFLGCSTADVSDVELGRMPERWRVASDPVIDLANAAQGLAGEVDRMRGATSANTRDHLDNLLRALRAFDDHDRESREVAP